MQSAIGIILLAAMAVFILYMAARILNKAGFSWQYAFLLLIPVVNVAMVWVFAFIKWPNLKAGVEQDLK